MRTDQTSPRPQAIAILDSLGARFVCVRARERFARKSRTPGTHEQDWTRCLDSLAAAIFDACGVILSDSAYLRLDAVRDWLAREPADLRVKRDGRWVDLNAWDYWWGQTVDTVLAYVDAVSLFSQLRRIPLTSGRRFEEDIRLLAFAGLTSTLVPLLKWRTVCVSSRVLESDLEMPRPANLDWFSRIRNERSERVWLPLFGPRQWRDWNNFPGHTSAVCRVTIAHEIVASLKRACGAATSFDLDESYKDALSRLGCEASPLNDKAQVVLRYIDRTVSRIRPLDDPGLAVPSLAACNQATRREGGVMSVVVNELPHYPFPVCAGPITKTVMVPHLVSQTIRLPQDASETNVSWCPPREGEGLQINLEACAWDDFWVFVDKLDGLEEHVIVDIDPRDTPGSWEQVEVLPVVGRQLVGESDEDSCVVITQAVDYRVNPWINEATTNDVRRNVEKHLSDLPCYGWEFCEPKSYMEPTVWARLVEWCDTANLAVERRYDEARQIFDDPLWSIRMLYIPHAYERLIPADLHGLKEALKIRNITASDGPMQHFCKTIQSAVHGQLRTDDRFKLIGQTILDEVGRCRKEALGTVPPQLLVEGPNGTQQLREGWGFLSADFKTATDYINMNVTLYTWERLVRQLRLDDLDAEIGRRLLCGCSLKATLSTGETISAPQRNGQLMGCILSFPILCIVNEAALEASIYESTEPQPTWVTKEQQVALLRVNGDDAHAMLSAPQKSLWEEFSKSTGLIRSPGKNYWSRWYTIINSQLYILMLGRWMYSPFINYGLLSGQGRVLSDTRRPNQIDTRSLTPGAICKSLLLAHPSPLQKKLRSLFIKLNKEKLQGRPFWVSEYNGGWGLPLLQGETLETMETNPRTWCGLTYLTHQPLRARASLQARLRSRVELPEWVRRGQKLADRYVYYSSEADGPVPAYTDHTWPDADFEDFDGQYERSQPRLTLWSLASRLRRHYVIGPEPRDYALSSAGHGLTTSLHVARPHVRS